MIKITRVLLRILFKPFDSSIDVTRTPNSFFVHFRKEGSLRSMKCFKHLGESENTTEPLVNDGWRGTVQWDFCQSSETMLGCLIPCLVTSSSFFWGQWNVSPGRLPFQSTWCLWNSSSYEAQFIRDHWHLNEAFRGEKCGNPWPNSEMGIVCWLNRGREGRYGWSYWPTWTWVIVTKPFEIGHRFFTRFSLFELPLHLGVGGQYHSMVDMREDQILGSCGLGTSSLWVFDGIGTSSRCGGSDQSSLLPLSS